MIDELLRRKISERFTETEDGINPFYISPGEIEKALDEKKRDLFFPGLEPLAEIFGLDRTEREILALVAAPAIDPLYERIYAYLSDDMTRKYPTIPLLAFLLDETPERFFDRFSPEAPLIFFRLIRSIEIPDAVSFQQRALAVDESVRDFLLGAYRPERRFLDFMEIYPVKERANFSLETERFLRNAEKEKERRRGIVVHLYGEAESRKFERALEIASAYGYGLMRIDTPSLLHRFDDFVEEFPSLFRESVLSGTLLYFDRFDSFFEEERFTLSASAFKNVLERYVWLVFFSSKKMWTPHRLSSSHLFLSYHFPPPGPEESVALWRARLEGLGVKDPETVSRELAGRFTMTEEEMDEAVRLLGGVPFYGREADLHTAVEACRRRVSTRLETLAQPIHGAFESLDDIVLPEKEKETLATLMTHYRYQSTVFGTWGFERFFQSRGLGVLFFGPPGTGKTMAASILANALDLDLYRIDLSRVVSKYIGETEKNLSKIFETAEGAGVMLFFDEADAVFGKRTEVKDAHDRYANIEVSYLLQRIEAYGGLVVLATNFRKNVDEAFVRRMRFIVEFPFPDETMREGIWKKAFPAEAPLDREITFSYLAKNFPLSGAEIRNVALAAAFLAAEAGEPIRIRHIAEGLKRELSKTGRHFRESDIASLLNR